MASNISMVLAAVFSIASGPFKWALVIWKLHYYNANNCCLFVNCLVFPTASPPLPFQSVPAPASNSQLPSFGHQPLKEGSSLPKPGLYVFFYHSLVYFDWWRIRFYFSTPFLIITVGSMTSRVYRWATSDAAYFKNYVSAIEHRPNKEVVWRPKTTQLLKLDNSLFS